MDLDFFLTDNEYFVLHIGYRSKIEEYILVRISIRLQYTG